MLEQPKNTRLLARSGTTGSQYELLISYFIKLIILPFLLFYANTTLTDLSDNVKELTKEQASLSAKLDVYKTNAEDYKIVIDKELKFLDYRISILESEYGKIHSKLYGDWTPERKRNTNSVGAEINFKQPDFNQ